MTEAVVDRDVQPRGREQSVEQVLHPGAVDARELVGRYHFDLRHPVGQVLGSQSSVYGLVDEEGVIFSQSPLPLELPQLNMSQDIQPNTRLALSQSQAMSALNDIWQLTASLPVGSLEGTQLTASLRSGLNIIISVDQPASSWYPPLQSILDRSKMGSKLPKKIDMRFTNPVLMY